MAAAGPAESSKTRDLWLRSLEIQFRDSVTGPYTEKFPAVSLIKIEGEQVSPSCDHIVSKAVAEVMKIAGSCCPTCQRPFTHFVENPIVTRLSIEFSDIIKRAPIPVIPDYGIAAIPFPGERAHFELRRAWGPVESTAWPLVRQMGFKARNPNATFSEFRVSGYKDGKLNLSLYWKKDLTEQIEDYFSSCGIIISITDTPVHYKDFAPPRPLDTIFHILSLHNQIPEPHLALIQKLVIARDWRLVPS